MGRAALLVALALMVATGCRRGEPPPAPVESGFSRMSLRPVTKPALGGAEQRLRERIDARYALLETLQARPDAPEADLAAAYGEVGKLLLGAEFLNESEPYFANAQMLAPSEFAWTYYLAQVHRLRSQPDAAITMFQRALAARPDDVATLVWLGATYVDAGRMDDARPLLEKAVALSPESAAARFWLGRAALATGEHGLAIDHLEAALKADPQALPAHYPLAMAYRARGDVRQAEAHLARWKEGRVNPDDPLMEEITSSLQTAVSYEVLGTKALESRKWDEAVALFRKGLEVSPRDATLHQNLGTALFLAGDPGAASYEFQEALRLSPGYARAHFSLGVLLDASGRDDEAVRRFTDAVTYDSSLATARFALAEALRRTGQLEAALTHYDRLLADDTAASQARFGRAMALVRLRRFGDARKALEEAASMHPDQPGFAHALARVLAAAPADGVRDGDRAWTIVQTLEKQYGANLALSETAAMALAEIGRFDEAVRRQRGVIEAAGKQGRTDVLPTLRANLASYESRTPCRQPWADDDPVHRPRSSAPPS